MTQTGDPGSPTIGERLARIETLLETELRSLNRASTDMEIRLRKLEERRFPLQSLAVAVSCLTLIASVAMFLSRA